jgi:hypothetical protein
LKLAKKLLPYIDIGEANRGMARSMKTKKRRKGANTAPDKGERGSAYKFRQIFSTGEDLVLPLFPIFCMTTDGREVLLLKTCLFLSFQISHVMSVIAEPKPFGEEVVVFETASQ